MSMDILVKVEGGSSDVLGGSYGNGHSVITKLTGFNWGACDGPPEYVRITVTDAGSADDIEQVLLPWERQLSYTIMSDDPSSDTFGVNIFADPVISSTNPVAQITLQDMKDFLIGWGATDISATVGTPGVTFQISAFSAIKSKGLFTFGDAEDSMLKYVEQSYDPASGIHTVQMDYSLTILKPQDIETCFSQCPAITLISLDDSKALCVFSANRQDMITALENQVADKFTKKIARVRYRWSDALVALALSNRGLVSITLADINSNIVDVSTEV